MRVILLRRMKTKHADYSIGTILNYSRGPAERLVKAGKAEKYNGVYPPRKKMRTKFFKPK